MAVQYEPVIDELSQSDELPERPEIYFIQDSNKKGRKWPRSIGIVQIVIGILIALLGTLEVFVVPIIEDHKSALQFNRHTCYGAGLFAGLVMVLTGSTAVRASLSKRDTTPAVVVQHIWNVWRLKLMQHSIGHYTPDTVIRHCHKVYRFYNLTLLTLLIYTGFTVFLVVAYSKGWTTESAYPVDSNMHTIHMFVTIFVVLGLMFALTAVVQYYDVVCCGELKLAHKWAYCLFGLCLGNNTRRMSESAYSRNPDSPNLLI